MLSRDKTQLALVESEKGLSDFGGKSEPQDLDTWHTARRECREECGVTVTEQDQLGCVELEKFGTVYTLYVCTLPEGISIHDIMTETSLVRIVLISPADLFKKADLLHPRLKYSKGYDRSQIESLMGVSASSHRMRFEFQQSA